MYVNFPIKLLPSPGCSTSSSGWLRLLHLLKSQFRWPFPAALAPSATTSPPSPLPRRKPVAFSAAAPASTSPPLATSFPRLHLLLRNNDLVEGHHEMKRSFPWEEAVTIYSSDSDCEEDKQVRPKRDKKDCSSGKLEDITSEGTLIRLAGMYQEYMKRIPIPTFSGSVVPFTSWQGLAKSLKKLYGQPLHYLTNSLLKQWDSVRFGSENEHQALDAVVHPVKAQILIWLTEELHRLTASPYHLAKLWASDPMYHSQIDPFLSY